MIRLIAIALLLTFLFNGSATAQEPQISFELESETVVVGQPLVLRIKVLVPTWMPKAPDFPTLEIPSLMVRLPERATSPISEQIEGETWAGVQRAYRLYPLAPGDYQLPTGDVAITYADPATSDPIAYSVQFPDIRFVATMPKEAANLSPPVLANGFTLEQNIEGESELTVGDAITRTLTAQIQGTTPVLIPQLFKEETATALRSYPKDPVVTESEDQGTLSGTRTEIITYVAQADGNLVLPEIAIDWFNLETGKIETASVPEIPLAVSGAPPKPPEPAEIVKWFGLIGVALAIIWGIFSWFRPTISHWINALRDNWHTSERYAHRAVLAAIANQQLSAVMPALDHWKSVVPASTPGDFDVLDNALAGVGATRFGGAGHHETTDPWRQVAAAYSKARAHLRTKQRANSTRSSLPPLNP